MEINPYQSPGPLPAKERRTPVVWPFLLLVCLAAVCIMLRQQEFVIPAPTALPYGRLYWEGMYETFLSGLTVLAVVGFVTFTAFARRIGAKVIYLSRDLCIAQLVALGLPFLNRNVAAVCLMCLVLASVSAIPVLLHFTLRRFEQLPSLAARLTLPAILLVDFF